MQDEYKKQIDLLQTLIKTDDEEIEKLSKQIGELNRKINEIERVRHPLQKLNAQRNTKLTYLIALKTLDAKHPGFKNLTKKQQEYLVQWDKEDGRCYTTGINNGYYANYEKVPYGFLSVLASITEEDLLAIVPFIDVEKKYTVYKSNGWDEADDVYTWSLRQFVWRLKQIAILFPSEAPPQSEIKRKRCSNCLHELND
jgi:hypothetical protein